MATDPSRRSLEGSTRELLATLREIEDAIEPPSPRRFVRPPTPRGLVEFTSEVAIPGAILVLRTNIAALELFQRSLRMVNDRSGRGGRENRTDDRTRVPERAADLTTASLSRLDDALADLQSAIDGRSIDRSPDDLLAEARRRTEDLEAQLSSVEGTDRDLDEELGRRGATEVDVEAELDSLRESVDRGGDGDDHEDSPTDTGGES